jgi:hypothetical protein
VACARARRSGPSSHLSLLSQVLPNEPTNKLDEWSTGGHFMLIALLLDGISLVYIFYMLYFIRQNSALKILKRFASLARRLVLWQIFNDLFAMIVSMLYDVVS